jgi:hypothetical protein
MADDDIPSDEHSIKKSRVSLVPTPFEQWALACGYDIAPPLALPNRKYNDPLTEKLHEAWQARGEHIARLLTESTLDTEALREKILGLA